MKTISVVVPAFNSEDTLPRLLQSLLDPSLEFLKEIIVVNDGSTDNTESIAQKYASESSKVKVLSQVNSGAGVARNSALKLTSGDYVFFCDADDVVDSIKLCEIHKRISFSDPDILVFTYGLFNQDSNKPVPMPARDWRCYSSLYKKGIFPLIEAPELLEAISYPWNKIFKLSFVKKIHAYFSPTKVNNDILFNVYCFSHAEKIEFIDCPAYVHFVSSSRPQLTNIFDESRDHVIDILKECEKLLIETGNFKVCEKHFNAFKFDLLFWILNQYNSEKIKGYFAECIDQVSDESAIYLLNSNMIRPTVKDRIRISLGKRKIQSKNNLILSVIVPVYNVESYLEECLNSIETQTLSQDKYEVIVIDDCSSDNSLTVAKQFKDRIKNFHIIELTENTPGGAGIPSNIGMKSAKGEFIIFVDSDDFIAEDMFESMTSVALNEHADIVISDFQILNNLDGTITPSYDKKKFHHALSVRKKGCGVFDVRNSLLEISPIPWRKLYKRKFLESFNIRYPEGDYFFEDNPLHWFVSVYANRVSYIDKVFATHRMQRAGQTMDKNPKRLAAFGQHIVTIFEFLTETKNYPHYEDTFIRWMCNQCNWLLPLLGEYEKEFSLSISPIVDKINKEKLQRNLGRYDKDVAKKMRSIFKVENTNSPVVMLLPNPIKIIKKLKHSILSSDKKSP